MPENESNRRGFAPNASHTSREVIHAKQERDLVVHGAAAKVGQTGDKLFPLDHAVLLAVKHLEQAFAEHAGHVEEPQKRGLVHRRARRPRRELAEQRVEHAELLLIILAEFLLDLGLKLFLVRRRGGARRRGRGRSGRALRVRRTHAE